MRGWSKGWDWREHKHWSDAEELVVHPTTNECPQNEPTGEQVTSSLILVLHTDGFDVFVFKDTASAELALEPIDVRQGTYEAFDDDGHALELTVEAGHDEQTGRVKIKRRLNRTALMPEHQRERLAERMNDVFVRMESPSRCNPEDMKAGIWLLAQQLGFSR